MKCNPGGRLAPDEVLGRDLLIADLWDCLQRQSLLLTAERRMGKTSILQRMLRRPEPGFLPLYRDLEALRSPAEFTEAVLRDLSGVLGGTAWVEGMLRKVKEVLRRSDIGALTGLELDDFSKGRWKEILTHALTALSPTENRRVLLLWDEFPLMLVNITADCGWAAAAEVLDTLRAARHADPPLRMVLTGSIGLHHAISRLAECGYRNRPTNDMRSFDVPPLVPQDGVKLARELLAGEAVEVDDIDAVAYEIATGVDQVPFFIQHVVAAFKARRRPVVVAEVADLIREAVRDPGAGWDLEQYQTRVGVCYLEADQTPVLTILDFLAAGPRTLGDLEQALAEAGQPVDRERLRSLLSALEMDHYLVRDEASRYAFRLGIVARWWNQARGG